MRIWLSTASMLAACAASAHEIATPGNAAPADTLAEAAGRRILSTAFVRVGPDGHMTVALNSGQELVLRDVVMRPTGFCGVQVGGGAARGKFCGGYAAIAAARPGGAEAVADPPQPATGSVPRN